MLDKKAYVLQKIQVKHIWYSLLLVFVALVMSFVFAQAVSTDINTFELETHSAIYRVLGSSNCFVDNSDSYFGGSVDISKFDGAYLSSCFASESNQKIGIGMVLYYLNGTQAGNVELNPDVVTQKITCGLKNSNYNCFSTRKYVLIKDAASVDKGYLDMEVVSYVG